MNPDQLSRIVLRGFKSIRDCDLELKDLNVLIGPNGAGKSNFIGLFHLIRLKWSGKFRQSAKVCFDRKETENEEKEIQRGI